MSIDIKELNRSLKRLGTTAVNDRLYGLNVVKANPVFMDCRTNWLFIKKCVKEILLLNSSCSDEVYTQFYLLHFNPSECEYSIQYAYRCSSKSCL